MEKNYCSKTGKCGAISAWANCKFYAPALQEKICRFNLGDKCGDACFCEAALAENSPVILAARNKFNR